MENNFENEDVLTNNERIIEIVLWNPTTGIALPGVPVYGTNTFDQVIKEYAKDIGIGKTARRLLIQNKRTGEEAKDINALIESLGLQNGDVLVISDYF